MLPLKLNVEDTLPADPGATLVGRVWRTDVQGPAIVRIGRSGAGGPDVVDISRAYPTMRVLCEAPDPARAAREAPGEPLGALADILANTPPDTRDAGRPHLLAPIDLQAVKPAGVTFAVSTLAAVCRT